MRWLKAIGNAAGAVLAVLVIAVTAALWVYRDVPATELEAKYGAPSSRFIHIDGVRIHYRDEGSGPAILLLHANFSSLLGWDPWADELKDKYRVLRFDFTAFGLTGPDASGDYSNARTLVLTERFADALGLKRFVIGGASWGGGIAIRYAAKHPDRVEKLILLNPSIIEGQASTRAGKRVPDAVNILKYITPRALASYMLRSRAGDPSKITEEHVDRWYEMWLREGNRGAMLQRLRVYDSSDVAEVVASVQAPVLILWGEANPKSPVQKAFELRGMLKNAPEVRLVTYPGVGRPALEEAGSEIGRDVRAYLDGNLAPGT